MTDQHAHPDKGKNGLFNQLRQQSKQLAALGQHMLQRQSQAVVSRISPDTQPDIQDDKVIDMKKTKAVYSRTDERHTPHSLFRQQLPGLTRQLLGKRFNSINKFAKFVAPQGSFDMASDQILELLADFASNLAETRKVLDEAGVATLAELQHDVGRSGRLSRALGEQSRILGVVQGALSGAFGVVGAAADLPASMVIALRTIYLTGRAYGFELDHPEDRTIVFEALSRVDLSLIAEKQAILLGLRSFGSLLDSGDLQHLQTLLGSTNNIEPLKNLLSDESGQLKWKLSPGIVSKIAPLLGGVAGAIYNARLIQEVSAHAQEVFAEARQHILSQQPKAESDTILLDVPSRKKAVDPEVAQLAAQQHILQSDTIEKVELVEKVEKAPVDEATQDQTIHQQIEALAHEVIEHTPVVKPASKPRTRKAPVKKAVSPDTGSSAAVTPAADDAAPNRRASAKAAAPTDTVSKAAESVDAAAPSAGTKPVRRRTATTKASAAKAASTEAVSPAAAASEDKPKAPRRRSVKAATKPDASGE